MNCPTCNTPDCRNALCLEVADCRARSAASKTAEDRKELAERVRDLTARRDRQIDKEAARKTAKVVRFP